MNVTTGLITVWSHCQALPLGYDLWLHALTGDPDYLADALAIVRGIQRWLTAPGGVLYEKGCEADPVCGWVSPPLPAACKCDNNQLVFKGIVVRYLRYLADYLARLGLESAAAAAINRFVALNAGSAYALNRAGNGDFGVFWQGPVFGAVQANAGNTNQAVLDLFTAAAPPPPPPRLRRQFPAAEQRIVTQKR